jgi:hypothetical protein
MLYALEINFFYKKSAELLLVGHLLRRLAEQAGGLRASGGSFA